jgi:predicted nucleic acid-binding protein
VAPLDGPLVLDADVLIAFLDAADAQHETAVDALRPRLATGQRILIAASVYAEILVRPLQRGSDHAVVAFIEAIGATIVPIDRAIARRAAQLRGAHRSLRLPDAISLATALVAGAEYVTLDRRLGKVAEAEQIARKPR